MFNIESYYCSLIAHRFKNYKYTKPIYRFIVKLIHSFFFFPFLTKQFKQNKLELLNQRAQELIRQADSVNHTQIDEETAEVNSAWNKKLTDLQNHIDTLNVLCGHWQEFEKRVEQFENQLTRLDERNQNIDTAIKSKQHLDDTKHIYQVNYVIVAYKNKVGKENYFFFLRFY